MKKRIILLALCLLIALPLTGCNGNSVEFAYFTGNFSPFFCIQPTDLSVVNLIHEPIIVTSGDEAVIADNAFEQKLGISDISTDHSTADTLVTVTLGEGVTFSDGTPVTADDIIFSMYVYADRDYFGWSGFCDSPIEGMLAYRINNSEAENVKITYDDIQSALADPDAQLQQYLKDEILNPFLEAELFWVQHLYTDRAYIGTEAKQYTEQYAEAKDLFAFFYSIDKNFDSSSATEAEVLEAVKNQYGWDYKTLQTVSGEDFSDRAENCAEIRLRELAAAQTGGSPVDSISGIERIDDRTVRIKMKASDEDDIRSALGIYVAPLHYYGDTALYDYDNNKFGFTRGDLTAVHKRDGQPMGAGRYTFSGYKTGKSVSLDINSRYYGYTPEKPPVFIETGNSDVSQTHKWFITPDSMLYRENNETKA